MKVGTVLKHLAYSIAALAMLTTFILSCESARQPEHTSIFNEKLRAIRVVLLDAANKPIAGEDVELREIVQCGAPPCAPVVSWTQKSGLDGSVTIPRSLIHETTLVGTRANEPRELQAATWHQDRGAWTLALMGRATTICSKYDSSWTILVADGWDSAAVNASDELGLMHCEEGKDVFRTCQGPQVPDAGFTATFTRSGDNISARLTGETVRGPHEFAQLECFHLAIAQALPHDPKTWALEFSLTGGIAGLNRHLRLTQAGELSVSANSEELGSHITTHASTEVLAKIAGFLKGTRKARPADGGPKPDALNTSLALISGGSKYELEVTDNIGELLEHTIDATLRKALVGTWWESEWKLCHPAAQLTAEDVDPPIEKLVIEEDGRFSVTWQGGDARTTGVPYALIPDYSGKYVHQPDRSHIHMSFESGIYTPRDFSGDGYSWVNGDKLVLKNVWLGTYKAKRKPDICEMTFTRVSEHR